MMNQQPLSAGSTTRETTRGPVKLPILYHDASAVQGYFSCNYDRVSAALDGTGLEAARFINRRAMVVAAFFEYRETSIGSYNEVGVAIAVIPASKPKPKFPATELLREARRRTLGFYILDLPVTTAAACSAGRELWGYPKFITPLPFAVSKGRFEGSVLDPATQEAMVTFRSRFGRGVRLKGFDLLLYSNSDGSIVRTLVDVDTRVHTSAGRSARLTVGQSDHRMANNLRELGLDGARPFCVQTTNRFRSRLNIGTPTSAWQTPPLAYGDTPA